MWPANIKNALAQVHLSANAPSLGWNFTYLKVSPLQSCTPSEVKYPHEAGSSNTTYSAAYSKQSLPAYHCVGSDVFPAAANLALFCSCHRWLGREICTPGDTVVPFVPRCVNHFSVIYFPAFLVFRTFSDFFSCRRPLDSEPKKRVAGRVWASRHRQFRHRVRR